MMTTTTRIRRDSLLLIGGGDSNSSSSSSRGNDNNQTRRGGNKATTTPKSSSLIGLIGMLIIGQLCFSSRMLSRLYSSLSKSNLLHQYYYDNTTTTTSRRRIITAVSEGSNNKNGNQEDVVAGGGDSSSVPPPVTTIATIKNVRSQLDGMMLLHNNNDNNKDEASAPSSSSSEEGSEESFFGACLLVKDDNHWLVEWLAYHYFVLPLKHLVIYIDPNSKTSPYPILDRWTTPTPYTSTTTNNRMNIEIWDDARYDPPLVPDFVRNDPTISPGRLEHYGVVNVQSRFIQDCMVHYQTQKTKKQKQTKKNRNINNSWPSWIVLVDADEFIAINDWTRDPNRSQTYRGPNVPQNHERGSVMTFLKQEQVRQQVEAKKQKLLLQKASSPTSSIIPDINKHPACIRMHRQQMCLEELPSNKRTEILEEDWEYGDFLTYNFRYGERGRQVKNMVNVHALDENYFQSDRLQLKYSTRQELNRNYNIHNPLPQKCPPLKSSEWELGPYLPREQALFQAYHYTGTLAQREFRLDKRGQYGNRTKAGTPPPLQCLNATATDLRPWLRGFIDLVGQDDAAWLLDGVGSVEYNWPVYEGPKKSKTKAKPTTTTTAAVQQQHGNNSNNDVDNNTLASRIASKVLLHHAATAGLDAAGTAEATTSSTDGAVIRYIRSFPSLGRGPLKFLHTPKAGGTTIEALAAKHNMTWGVCSFPNKKRGKGNKKNEIDSICSHNSHADTDQSSGRWPLTDLWHEPRQYYPLAGIDPYTSAELFTVVRNPYDRQISEFNYQCRRNYHCNKSQIYDKMYMNEWLTNNLRIGGASFLHLKHITPGIRRHYIPQYAFVVSGPNNDVRMIDHVLHMESMSSAEAEFDRLVKAYSLPESFQLKQRMNSKTNDNNSSTSEPYHLTVNDLIPSTIKLINQRFPNDAKPFGYEVKDELDGGTSTTSSST